MASLKRHPGSPFWIACYRKANGERTQRTTKQKDRDQAWKVCLAWADAEHKAWQGALTEVQARRVIAEIVERTAGEPLQFYAVQTWLQEWVDGKQQTKAESTSIRYAQVIDDFLASLGKRGDLNIAHIAPRDVKLFRDGQLRAGLAGKTCNTAIKIIGAAFNAARRQGLIQTNPVEALESLPHHSESKEVFTVEQVGELLRAAPSEDWRGAMLLAYFTGARLQDVANMSWTDVDLSEKLIRFTPRKTARTGKAICVPIHPQLESHLLHIAGQDNPKAFLFPSLAGRKTGGAHGLSKTFARIMDKAGIKADAARPRNGSGRAVSRLSFHSFRHGFNSMMANRGVAQEVRQKLTGHASPEVNKLYTHHEVEPLRVAVNVIPSVRTGKGK